MIKIHLSGYHFFELSYRHIPQNMRHAFPLICMVGFSFVALSGCAKRSELMSVSAPAISADIAPQSLRNKIIVLHSDNAICRSVDFKQKKAGIWRDAKGGSEAYLFEKSDEILLGGRNEMGNEPRCVIRYKKTGNNAAVLSESHDSGVDARYDLTFLSPTSGTAIRKIKNPDDGFSDEKNYVSNEAHGLTFTIKNIKKGVKDPEVYQLLNGLWSPLPWEDVAEYAED